MAVVIKVKSDTAVLYTGESSKWTKYYIDGGFVAFLDVNGFDAASKNDGYKDTFVFNWMKEDAIKQAFYDLASSQYGFKTTSSIYKGTTFGKKVPNDWSVMAKLLEIGFPLADVPNSGVKWEWTREDLLAYIVKLEKAIRTYSPGITINNFSNVVVPTLPQKIGGLAGINSSNLGLSPKGGQ